MSDNNYPAWVCEPCGSQHGNKSSAGEASTWHEGECGVCGETAIVTEPRDFAHLKDSWRAASVK